MIAARCLTQQTGNKKLSQTEFAVVLGAFNISKCSEHGRSIHYPASVTFYDYEDANNSKVAIAKIELDNSVQFNKYIRPVCVAENKISLKTLACSSGWKIHNDIKKTPVEIDLPLRMNYSIIDSEKCLKENPQLSRVIHVNNVCAEKQNIHVCNADVGSGLLMKMSGKYYVRGILTSIASRKCKQTKVTIFSDISRFQQILIYEKKKVNRKKKSSSHLLF